MEAALWAACQGPTCAYLHAGCPQSFPRLLMLWVAKFTTYSPGLASLTSCSSVKQNERNRQLLIPPDTKPPPAQPLPALTPLGPLPFSR